MKSGIISAALAYILWGILPVFWKAIQTVPAWEILPHRIAWSFVFVSLFMYLRRQWSELKSLFQSRRTLITFMVTAAILGVNWFTYIWAVNAGFVVDASLGYFINPLLSVLLGVVFLSEKLRKGQWIAIGIAALGVLYLTVSYGKFPWVAVILALTFGTYGLLRKTAALGAASGITVEMSMLLLPAVGFLIWLEFSGQAAFGHVPFLINVLLILTGLVTVIPLVLFASAAKKITLTNLGLLQYFAPTFQFLIGVFLYHEDFSQTRMIGFCIIWLALLIYTCEGLYIRHQQQLKPVAELG